MKNHDDISYDMLLEDLFNTYMKLRKANLDKDPISFIVLDTLSHPKEYSVNPKPFGYPRAIDVNYIKATAICGVY